MVKAGVVIGAVAGYGLAAALLSGCSGELAPTVGSSDAGSAASSAAHTPLAGAIPDNQAFVAFTALNHSYSVKIPQDWAQTTAGSELRFTDKSDSITLSPRAGFYYPTEAYARVVEAPEIARTAKGFALGEITMVQRHAGPVILVTYHAESPPDPVTGKSVLLAVERYEFAKPGRGDEVVLTVCAPAGSDNVTPWRLVTDSFSWLS